MKTMEDFKAIYSKIIEAVTSNPHDIAEDELRENFTAYREDGWEVEIEYECTGEFSHSRGDWWTPEDHDLISGRGNVTNISAYHTDPETEEETYFEGHDLDEITSLINRELEYIY